jgi:methionine aminopeptidase
MYRRTIDQCRVGTKASAIPTFAVEQLRAHGYNDRVSLVGHGVGPWWHQQDLYRQYLPSDVRGRAWFSLSNRTWATGIFKT